MSTMRIAQASLSFVMPGLDPPASRGIFLRPAIDTPLAAMGPKHSSMFSCTFRAFVRVALQGPHKRQEN
jgi:hypothetical protein